MPFNIADFMGPFLDEADEQLGSLSQGLLALEINPRDPETVQSIFRAAHSLKGAAGSMGFVAVAALAHKMESLLEEVRSQHLPADRAMIDLLLRGVDRLKSLVGEIASSAGTQSDPSDLCAEMEGFLERPPEASASRLEPAGPPAAPVTPGCYRVRIALDPAQPMKDVKAFLLLQNLEAIACIEHCCPERAVITDGAFHDRFEVIVTSAAPVERLAAACNLGGVLEATVEPGAMPSAAPAPAGLPPAATQLDLPEAAHRLLAEALQKGQVFFVAVGLRGDSALPEARHFLVYNNLRRAGRVLWSDPDGSRLEDGHTGRQTRFLVACPEAAALKRACNVAYA